MMNGHSVVRVTLLAMWHIAIFVTKSIAKAGAISSVVPMVSHTDHTEHDVDVLVTEQGLANIYVTCTS